MPLSLSFVPLPLNAKKLISEYSKPVTRPDWRTFERKLNTVSFISQIVLEYKIKVFRLVRILSHTLVIPL